MNKEELLILGAGLSSLGFYNAINKGVLYEKSDRPGGHAKSFKVGNSYFDQGAHICHSKNPDWLKRINTENISNIKGNVVNYQNGNIISYPVQNNLIDLTQVDRIKALEGVFNATKITATPTNYLEWLLSQYGEYLTNEFYIPFTLKYWRTEPQDLSIDWLKGRLLPVDLNRILKGSFSKDNESQAAFNYFKYPKDGGFESFFSGLYKDLPIKTDKNAVEISLKHKTVKFSDGTMTGYSKLVSSISLKELCDISIDLPSELKELSKKLFYLNLIQINIITKKISEKFKGVHWFYVYDKDIDISRISLLHNVKGIEDSNPIIQAEIFRRNDENYNMDSIVEKGVNDLMKIFDISRDQIEIVEPKKIEYSYVVSDENKTEIVNQLTKYFEGEGVKSIGLYGKWDYVWSDKAYENGYNDGKKYYEENYN